MLYYLDGTLLLPDLSNAVIDCGGVGYKLAVSTYTRQKLAGKDGQRVRLFTYMDVKEGGIDLFGFYTEEEQTVFRHLITVSGVGPKAAIAVLSALSPDRLRLAVSAGDTRAIMTANGVGKKIAERIILELKEKLTAPSAAFSGDGGDFSGSTDSLSSSTGDINDALSGLVMLGYSRSEAAEAIRKIGPAGKSLEEIVRLALKQLMKK